MELTEIQRTPRALMTFLLYFLYSVTAEWISKFNADIAVSRYFAGFGYPPDIHELALLIDNIRTLEEAPQIHILKDRKYADPCYAVEMAEKENRDIYGYGIDLYYEHEIIRDLYPSVEDYLKELSIIKKYGKESQLRTKVEEIPFELIELDNEPYYDLDELVNEVKQEFWDGKFDGISSVSWTDKFYKKYFGIHYCKNHTIMINSILNSKDVPREAVKFVIYHELLHRDHKYHDKSFREFEHKFPDYEKWEHFLYGEMLKYEISEM